MKAQNDESRCSFTYRDGRRCRMLISREHPSLCVFHYEQQRKAEGVATRPRRLLTTAGALDNRRAIRRSLKRVVRDLVDGRLSSNQARVLAELGRLLLVYTHPAGKRSRKGVAQGLTKAGGF